ncbi:MAG: 16S rRNA processing protein RimM, partial [Clostridia bacterium]|nr:16S rRNA processing protein RimM [Clostridia bacterium]
MEKILIGTVLKPHGIKGELKIKYFADSFASIKNCKVVFIDGKEYKVTKLKLDSGDFAFLGLDGVIDRNMSELFRNKEVYA